MTEWEKELWARVRRFRLHCWLRRMETLAVEAIATALFAGALAVLALRFAGIPALGIGALVWGVVAVAGIVAVGIFAWRQLPEPAALLCWLEANDPRGRGLWVAAAQGGLGEWEAVAALPELPRFRSRNRWRAAVIAAGAVLFAAGCMLMPLDGDGASVAPPVLDVEKELAHLEEQLDLLKELDRLPEAQVEALEAQLAETAEPRDGADAAEVFERMEALEEALDAAGSQVAAEMSAALEANAAIGAAASALESAGAPDAPGSEAAFREFGDLVAESGTLSPDLGKALSEWQNRPPSKGELDAVREALKNSSEELRRQLSELANCRNPGQNPGRNQGRKPGESGSGGAGGSAAERARQLAEWLEANRSGASELTDWMAQQGDEHDGRPGTGGIQRGRGDADLHIDERKGNVKYAGSGLTELPHASEQPAESELIASFVGAPRENETPVAASAGALSVADSGAERNELRILPRHRAGVARYFDNESD